MIRVGSRSWPTRPSPDPDDPLAPARGQSLDGLLALLERLDGAEEARSCAARSARASRRCVVLEELQREVERRLMRTPAVLR